MKNATSDNVIERENSLHRWAHNVLSSRGQHLIGGEFVDGSSDVSHVVVDPSTGLALGDIRDATESQVASAVASAADAQDAWFRLGPYERMRTLNRLADLIDEHADELGYIEALDSGNPVRAMRKDISIGTRSLRHLAALGLSVTGATIPSRPHRLHYTVHQPFGVVGRIIPFNHPAMFFISKCAAPLIMGNALVIKPPEQAPLSGLYLAELFQEVLPKGLVNIINGGPETGQALVQHPDVKRIAFTGSVPTAKKIQAAAAVAGIKTVSMELGGKNPMLVLPDADLEEAVEAGVEGMNLEVCQGQSCGSNSRILLPDSMFDEYKKRLVERLANIRIGPAYSSETDMGPLVSQTHLDRVTSYIDSAKEEDIRIAFGGSRPSMGRYAEGYYVQPTLLIDPPLDSAVANEEIFGPVISLLRWDDLDAAIEVANGVEYGLTASVWTRDVNLAHRVAQKIRAGYVWINQHGAHYTGTPFGGMKASGVGRDESIDELESYTEIQTIHLTFSQS